MCICKNPQTGKYAVVLVLSSEWLSEFFLLKMNKIVGKALISILKLSGIFKLNYAMLNN